MKFNLFKLFDKVTGGVLHAEEVSVEQKKLSHGEKFKLAVTTAKNKLANSYSSKGLVIPDWVNDEEVYKLIVGIVIDLINIVSKKQWFLITRVIKSIASLIMKIFK